MKLRSIVRSVVAILTLATATATGTPAATRVHVTLPHYIHGVILSVAADGLSLQFRKRNNVLQTVDLTEAQANHATGMLPVGDGVIIYGYRNADGSFHAISVGHASQNPSQWNADNE